MYSWNLIVLFVKEIHLHWTGLSVFAFDLPIQQASHFSTLIFKEEKVPKQYYKLDPCHYFTSPGLCVVEHLT